MMFRIFLSVLYWGTIGVFLWYAMPQYDIMRITNTYERRVSTERGAMFYAQSATNPDGTPRARDIFFIEAFDADDNVMVYRNEDTGSGWPPYFKFNSANLQARASELVNSAEGTQWVAIRHYGMRLELSDAFPNAISIEPVAGPNAPFYPWFTWLKWTGILAVLLFIRARWMRLRLAYIDPVFEEIADRIYFLRQKF